jgi:predicted transcriptional regulator
MKKEININQTLGILGLKPASKRVLIALSEESTMGASDIASKLNMPKSSVYDSLNELIEKSLVTEYSEDRGKTFAISDNEQIVRIHKQKIEELQNAQAELVDFIARHNKKSQTARPRIKFYSGVEGIKQAFRDMSWNSEYKEAYLMWPTSDMIEMLGVEFLFDHRKPGIELDVRVNVIEPERDRPLREKEGHEWLKQDPANKLNKKRYAPKGTDWHMSYWIYGDKCLFASGSEEKIAFVVHSMEFANLQQLLWERMWEVCKE